MQALERPSMHHHALRAATTTTKHRALVVVRAATTATTKTAMKPSQIALNITKNSLINSQDGQTTRNVDGEIYRIKYVADDDTVLVENRKAGQQYVALITKDNRILIDLEEGTPLAVGMGSFEDWQRVFKFDGTGPELVTARVAMLSIVGLLGVEATTHTPVVQQLLSVQGAVGAVAVSVAVIAASVAPVLAGKASPATVFPTANDSYANRQLPYYFTYLAEVINGRLAMLGIAGIIAQELVRGGSVL